MSRSNDSTARLAFLLSAALTGLASCTSDETATDDTSGASLLEGGAGDDTSDDGPTADDTSADDTSADDGPTADDTSDDDMSSAAGSAVDDSSTSDDGPAADDSSTSDDGPAADDSSTSDDGAVTDGPAADDGVPADDGSAGGAGNVEPPGAGGAGGTPNVSLDSGLLDAGNGDLSDGGSTQDASTDGGMSALDAAAGDSGGPTTEPPPDGQFRWFSTCGAPVCGPDVELGIPACTAGAMEGQACSEDGSQCDAALGCGAALICAESDPKLGPGGCPLSRARFKQDIEYVSDAERGDLAEQVLALPLATYHYINDPEQRPQLGFIIEDVEPSLSVDSDRDRVNLYAYTTMVVAALQEQQQEIARLRAELEALRDHALISGAAAQPKKDQK